MLQQRLSLILLGALALTPGCSSSPEPLTKDSVVRGPAPSFEEVADASYSGLPDGSIQLSAGKWQGAPYRPDGAAAPRAGLVANFFHQGDLDGDGREEAYAMLWFSSGGTGQFSYLAGLVHHDGDIQNTTTAQIGDRVQLVSSRLADRELVLDVVQAGPDDPMCCPSQKATRRWRLVDGALVEGDPVITGTLSLQDLAVGTWTLAELGRGRSAPTEPQITLSFEGETVSGHSGCNRFSGAATSEAAGMLSVGPLAGTRMACTPEIMDLESRFLKALGHSTGYGFVATDLVLSGVANDETVYLSFRRQK